MRRARGLLRSAQRLVPPGRDHLVVLAYHLVGAGTGLRIDLAPERFEDHLGELVRIARVVSLPEALAGLAQGRSPAGLEVAITFDDAYGNFHHRVWPRLVERGLPCTLFVPAGFVEGVSGSPIAGTDGLPPLTWDQLREMAVSPALTIGSHTFSHPDLRRLSDDDVRSELERSRDLIARRLGRTPEILCYPRGLWSRRLEPIVAETYRWAVVGGGRAITPGNFRPHRVWRTSLREDGPARLEPLARSRRWIEEWLADLARRRR